MGKLRGERAEVPALTKRNGYEDAAWMGKNRLLWEHRRRNTDRLGIETGYIRNTSHVRAGGCMEPKLREVGTPGRPCSRVASFLSGARLLRFEAGMQQRTLARLPRRFRSGCRWRPPSAVAIAVADCWRVAAGE